MSWSSLIDSISRGMAFFPPSPPSYTLEAHGDGGRELYIAPTQRGLRRVLRAEVFQIPVGSGRDAGTVVAALIPAPAGSAAGRRTLLHSHGNAVDLGQMLPLYEQLAKLLRCNIMAYDYRGYGRSTGRPGASTALADAAAGHERLLQRFGRRPEEVILYGQSVGSGPTCWLAARSPGLGGAVLHSAFLSGVRVIKPGLKAWPSALDIFPNLKYVPKVEAPTLVVHGTDDNVIEISHGKQLHALCKRPSEPLWAEGAGHQDLEAHPQFVPTLRRFLKECWGEEYDKGA